jgi:hypothetical protein
MQIVYAYFSANNCWGNPRGMSYLYFQVGNILDPSAPYPMYSQIKIDAELVWISL